MGEFISLRQYLDQWSGDDPERRAVAAAVVAIADASAEVATLIARGPMAGALGAVVGDNADGDAQKELDVRANDRFVTALRSAPVALVGSEELKGIMALKAGAPLAVAIDPLDGSSNIDVNVSIGTIFSVHRMTGATNGSAEAVLLQPGVSQLAAGFVIYGPQTALVLTVLQGTQVFTLDHVSGRYLLTRADIQVPLDKREFAINASNYRHWEEPVRAFIDDCVAGTEGPRGVNFNMRWIASLVAEAFRVLTRGGLFLYPRDDRPGYERGRLRLVYEANPMALIMEQAGGAATDGENRILDIQPQELHQRVPLVFGSRDYVEAVVRYHKEPASLIERSPLFGYRGLFRN
jgi:fructose-1,6-bisphosphatase I